MCVCVHAPYVRVFMCVKTSVVRQEEDKLQPGATLPVVSWEEAQRPRNYKSHSTQRGAVGMQPAPWHSLLLITSGSAARSLLVSAGF